MYDDCHSQRRSADLPVLGFLGLGLMGQPMAANLARAGMDLVVWNRTRDRADPVLAAGARWLDTPQAVLREASTIFVMLANAEAIDDVLEPGSERFRRSVCGRTLVLMGTTDPGYSQCLEHEVLRAGGRYVEAPVSGSRVPAENGSLVAMLASQPGVAEQMLPLFEPMCAETFVCGPVPQALQMKLAVNLFLITMVTGLAESVHFAEQHLLDAPLFHRIIDATPMASNVSKVKVAKLVSRDLSAQAAVADVLQNNRLVLASARASGAASPLLDVCESLYEQAVQLGHGGDDMAAVIAAIEARAGRVALLPGEPERLVHERASGRAHAPRPTG